MAAHIFKEWIVAIFPFFFSNLASCLFRTFVPPSCFLLNFFCYSFGTKERNIFMQGALVVWVVLVRTSVLFPHIGAIKSWLKFFFIMQKGGDHQQNKSRGKKKEVRVSARPSLFTLHKVPHAHLFSFFSYVAISSSGRHLTNPFIYDDANHIKENRRIHLNGSV